MEVTHFCFSLTFLTNILLPCCTTTNHFNEGETTMVNIVTVEQLEEVRRVCYDKLPPMQLAHIHGPLCRSVYDLDGRDYAPFDEVGIYLERYIVLKCIFVIELPVFTERIALKVATQEKTAHIGMA